MRLWKSMMGCALGGALVLSQGMAAFSQETVSLGEGNDLIAGETAMPQMGAGIGMSLPLGGDGMQDDLVGSVAMGAGMDLDYFDEAGEASDGTMDTDTVVLDDIGLTLRIQGAFMLQNAEDPGFYYIDTWGEHGMPNMMVGAFQDNTTEGFYDRYTEYRRKNRPDITVAEQPSAVTIGNKNLEKIVYNYGVQGYTVRDTRYIWLGTNDVLYMFAKREIPELDYMLGNSLEDIIAAAAVIGAGDQQGTPPSTNPAPGTSQPETTAPQAETTAPQTGTPAPQPETTAPQPETTVAQPETGVPSGQDVRYEKNEDSSWTVTTDYYTMILPPAWTNHFDLSVIRPENGGYNLKVVHNESAEEGFGGHLFSIMLIPEGEDYSYLPSYDYLGTMETPDGSFSVVVEYPTDLQTGGAWSPIYEILYGDKNTAITSMRPALGVTWILPDGKTINGYASSGDNTGQAAPQTQTTAPRPETTSQPETNQPDTIPSGSTQPAPTQTGTDPTGTPQTDSTVLVSPAAGSTDVLGTASGNSYSNRLFGFTFTPPASWILASQEQLVTLNPGVSADQFVNSIENGVPVCVAYAQSANGMEVMNVVVENGKSFMDPSITALSQEDIRAILDGAVAYASSSLESLGATVTGSAVNSVTCMGQTFYSLDITFDYAGFSGTQKQIGIPSGTYVALITVRSVSGDNTQSMLDMFAAA